MRLRPFGRTGLEISELVFGGGAVGGILIQSDADTRREAIRLALRGGVNWIDTAAAYGDGRSEESLGWLLREVDESPYVSTKFRIDPQSSEETASQIERSLEASLIRLQREQVDLLQLHNPVMPETGKRSLGVAPILGTDGVADATDRLVEQGLIRHIGFTALGDPAACRAIIASGRFASAQVYHNLLNPSAGRAMPARWTGYDFENTIHRCAEHGVAVMNIRVLAAGVIATDRRHGREGAIVPGTEVSSDEERTAAVFAELGDRYGTRAQTAMRYALSNAHVSGVLVGIAEVDQIDEALTAIELGPLPDEALAQLEHLYEFDFGLNSR